MKPVVSEMLAVDKNEMSTAGRATILYDDDMNEDEEDEKNEEEGEKKRGK